MRTSQRIYKLSRQACVYCRADIIRRSLCLRPLNKRRFIAQDALHRASTDISAASATCAAAIPVAASRLPYTVRSVVVPKACEPKGMSLPAARCIRLVTKGTYVKAS
eukprot:TRINITY_DN31607_c0_g1_i1.p1 TRINITY_DN31607_c0_g1~~TRINITY_DN31607_c0_g1_i1.p1  ORF type:complete len:107 (-),score=4.17 TRINITY_DN31607_c0_g1_i1:8-328(-)